METLLSPLLAALLISVIDFHWLFAGTAAGFLASAALVVSSRVPNAVLVGGYRVRDRVLSGARVFLATPRLRGLMGLNLAVAGAGSIVMVNTVNLVQDTLGRSAADVAWLLTANGLGVLVIAFAVPVLVARFGDRAVMLTGAGVLCVAAGCAVAFTFTSTGLWH
ncbi:MFS transporter, partial [Gordonia hydrophobica]